MIPNMLLELILDHFIPFKCIQTLKVMKNVRVDLHANEMLPDGFVSFLLTLLLIHIHVHLIYKKIN